jgi:lipoprotein-anchoring transpeptidase ErfK/SrfK
VTLMFERGNLQRKRLALRQHRAIRRILLIAGVLFFTLELGLAFALAFAAGDPIPSGASVQPLPSEPVSASMPPATPNVVAQALGSTVSVFQNPSARNPSEVLRNPTTSKDPLVFLVSDLTDEPTWIRVYLPSRPNGSQGWIRAAAVTLSADPYLVTVSLSSHSLTVFNDEQVVMSVPMGEGRSVLPTPTGTYFIVDLLRQPDPDGEYGPYAFGLSAFSNVLQSFGGGPGEIGIHGTNDPASVGANFSHGCIRLTNSTITALSELLPLGTPVVISR